MVVTVAVVSRNSRELLLRCLRSLEGTSASGRARVWVVDNASTDGSAAAAQELAPWAHVIEARRNLGFGQALNLVARASDDDWLLAATADVSLEAGALEAMLAAGGHPAVGCVAPRLVLPDGESEHSIHPLPSVALTIALNLGAQRLIPRLGERAYLDGYWNPDRPTSVPWASGACLLIRRTAFDAVGGFDGRQCMYADDLDFCWQLHEGGWAIVYEPAARVEHVAGAAACRASGSDRTAPFTQAAYPVITRRRGRVGAATIAAINLGGAAGRLAWMSPLALLRPRWRAPRDANRRWFAVHRRGMGVALRGDHAAPGVAAAGSS